MGFNYINYILLVWPIKIFCFYIRLFKPFSSYLLWKRQFRCLGVFNTGFYWWINVLFIKKLCLTFGAIKHNNNKKEHTLFEYIRLTSPPVSLQLPKKTCKVQVRDNNQSIVETALYCKLFIKDSTSEIGSFWMYLLQLEAMIQM